MRSKTPLALMEQLMMILVFALATAMCVQMFVLSDRLSRNNEAVSRAVLIAQNTAEEMKSRRPGFAELFDAEDGAVGFDGSVWTIAYDEQWNPIGVNPETVTDLKEKYRMEITEEEATVPGLVRVRVVVREGADTLFEIPLAWQEVSGHE